MDRFLTAILVTVAAAVAQPALAADPIAGGKVFKAQCSVCHANTASAPAGVGPSLAGVVGRVSGTQSAFHSRYSAAMKGAGKMWTPANLQLYIANPAKVVPGNQMPFAGLKDPAATANVIAYLATLH